MRVRCYGTRYCQCRDSELVLSRYKYDGGQAQLFFIALQQFKPVNIPVLISFLALKSLVINLHKSQFTNGQKNFTLRKIPLRQLAMDVYTLRFPKAQADCNVYPIYQGD